jgi:D-inositol-3-phosphate glycosyltransferase
VRIAIFSLNSDPLGRYGDEFTGGQSKYVRDVSAYLIGRGWAVDIVTLASRGEFEVEAPTHNCRIIRIPLGSGRALTYDDGADVIRPLLGQIEESLGNLKAIELLLSCYWLSAIPALELQRSLGIPHVFSMCSSGVTKQIVAHTVLTERIGIEREAVARATATIAVAPSEIKTLLTHYEADPERIVLIGRGIDLEKFQRRRRLLYVGRSTWSKGLDLLFAALRNVRDPSWDLVLLGPTNDDLDRSRCPLADLPGRVTVLGRQTNDRVAAELGLTDLLVVPSRYETFGQVALEAMAASVPVVASRAGGLADLVDHGITGLLFEPGDANDLAAKIRLAISDRRRLVEMGERGRDRALSYGWDIVGDRTARVFSRLANGHAAGTLPESPAER